MMINIANLRLLKPKPKKPQLEWLKFRLMANSLNGLPIFKKAVKAEMLFGEARLNLTEPIR